MTNDRVIVPASPSNQISTVHRKAASQRHTSVPPGSSETTIGLVDPTDASPGIAGTERHYHPDKPVTVLRQVKEPRKRSRHA
jgi:hypothetical protein